MERSNDFFTCHIGVVDAKVEGASAYKKTYEFCKIVESLGLQIVRAIMLLIAFLPILGAFIKCRNSFF